MKKEKIPRNRNISKIQ